ncbi:MAG: ferritin-like domain-containing protein [Rhodococcus sp.]|nr:ferritin-like domain-containing protein [Rhodococcus sp. (in: high G+C Gram-positive bacteria)]
MTKTENEALAEALAVEHGSVFAYGVVAAFASPERATLVLEGLAAHRSRRDFTTSVLQEAGVEPPVAAAGYAMPFPVTDPIAAAQLAAQIEVDAAIAWRGVVEHAEIAEVRRMGLAAMNDAATREAHWRIALGEDPATRAFPGQPA